MDMKRKLLTLAVAALAVASAYAVPARRLTRTVTQPDGSVVTVTLTGDEWFHTYVTSDGLAVDFTPEGHVVYRPADGISQVYAHEVSERSAAEQSFIADRAATLEYAAQRASSPKVQARQAMRAAVKAPMRSAQGRVSIEQQESQVPHKGVAHVPILLVQYKDVKFKDGDGANAVFKEFFTGEEKSAKKYFTDASMGKYDPQFHVYGPYTVSQNRVYYGGTDYWGNDERPGHMVKEAIQLADPEVDFSIFDNDGDGVCDVVIVLYAGVGQASSGVAQAVWPCQWDLASSGAGSVTCDGVRMTKFAVFNELNGSYQTEIDGVGTFCHEFSHCLGLPDFYETTYGDGYFGMGDWSLMDHGCYNNDGYTPIGYSAYEKAYMGWIDIVEGEKNTHYDLPVLNNNDTPESFALLLANDKDPNEYFIFENRARQGWDEFLLDEGMLITHVTYSASAWSGNTVNNYSLQRMTVVPADNRLTSSTQNADLWPKSYATEFTNTSTPAARTNTGTYLSKPVTEITRDPQTGAISFWVDRQPIPDTPAPVPAEPAVEEAGSFTASWAPVNVEGTEVSYTLQVWPATDGLPMPAVWTDFAKALDGWTLEGEYKLLSSSMYLGTAMSDGSMTSSTRVAPENGVATVVVNAKRYGADTDPVIILSLLDEDGVQAAVEVVDAQKSATYHSVAFSGLDDSKTYAVKVANRGKSKRVTLYSAMAFSGDCADCDDIDYDKALEGVLSSSSAPARAEQTVSGKRITITGITDTSYKVTGLSNIIYRYRVKAVPADPEKGKESLWSATSEIDLSTSGVTVPVAGEAASAFILVNGEIVATPGARLYSVSGAEVSPSAPGRFAALPGAYILVAPGHRPAKIVL